MAGPLWRSPSSAGVDLAIFRGSGKMMTLFMGWIFYQVKTHINVAKALVLIASLFKRVIPLTPAFKYVSTVTLNV